MSKTNDPPAAHGRGERKQITAVFIDVVGFSDIASTADAEDLQTWLEGFYAQSREIIEAHGGEVTEYLGDGIVAIFGLTHAHELAAAKAVNAGMTIINDVTSGPGQSTAMQLRIGVATGEVAVRSTDNESGLPRATGMVTTLAQRIQEAAEPGSVMMSQSTHVLLRNTIATQEAPDQILKGFAQAQTLYRPIAQTAANSPTQQVHFVGRVAERARIAKSTQPCLLIGQAGIGKTALAREFGKQADAVTTFSADGVHSSASYQPFRLWIMHKTGNTLPEFTDITRIFPDLTRNAHLALALVVGLPEGQRLLVEQSNLALKPLIENSIWQAIQADQTGGLLIIEDLHWLDNASLGVVVHMLQSEAVARYKILMTSRESTKIGKFFGTLPLTMIPLEALNDDDAGVMLAALSEGREPSPNLAELITRAGGIPLYLEQLFKRSTDDDTTEATVPGSLMDLLAEQIDATGATKPILQCAAVIGQRFDLETLAAISPPNTSLQGHLQNACARGVLEQTGTAQWAFSHALLQQAAYQSLLRSARITFHSKIATHLQLHHPDAVLRNPAILTNHLSLSQQHIPAIQNYLAVSKWALLQGAFDDAEAHIRAAIALCEQAPEEVDVRALEIACHTALGSTLMQTQGFTARPVKEAFERVAALAASQNAFSAANGPALYGTLTHAVLSADKPTSRRLLALLRDTTASVSADDATSELQVATVNASAALHFYTGNFDAFFPDADKLRSIYDFAKHGVMIADYGVDCFAATQMFEAVARAITGDSHLVADLSTETDAHQTLLNIPVMMPYALIWGAVPLYYAGEVDTAIARVLDGLQTAASQGAAFWQVTGAAWLNVMDPSQSATAEGLAGFEQVINAHEMIGANVGLAYFRAHYALALARHDRLEDAYQASLRATRENEENGLLCWYAEVLRIHAKVCQLTDKPNDAAQFLGQAAKVATEQNARLWLLRTRLDQFKIGAIDAKTLQDACDLFDPLAKPPEITTARSLLGHK